MEQLTQQLKSGKLRVLDVPAPVCEAGMVLVRNHYSLISPGTEASTVKAARAGLLFKARARPQQVRQALEVWRRQGLVQAGRAVIKKLEAYSPLGYSSAGEVMQVGGEVRGFAVGDAVACSGAGYASHAETVAVPASLCVRLAPGADLKRACYNTLGAVAMQGTRQADLRLGESCAVIGLGLVGQLTCLILRAAGVRVIGIDIDERVAAVARDHAADAALARADVRLQGRISGLTGGLGVDAVIITAGTTSRDPINLAGELARKRGRVVIVGAVPTGFDREPHYYRKELEVRMSCSTGPGRYDPDYEARGIDYPPAYVRWTQKRNMEAFQNLVHSGRINLDYLTTHVFPLDRAPQAYDLIVNRPEPCLGVVLKYDVQSPRRDGPVSIRPLPPPGSVAVAFIGAGSYAQSSLLPHLPRHDPQVALLGVMTRSGTTSRRVAERFGFAFCTSRPADILDHPGINTVFVATRHDSHAAYAMGCLRAGKHVFVEKPLAASLEDLNLLRDCVSLMAGSGHAAPILMTGFNRRFAPTIAELKRRLGAGPWCMLYRINAGPLPREHWVHDPVAGGGRIVSEICHFVDLLIFLCGSLPVRVAASAMPDAQGAEDTVCVNLEFADGSIGAINYLSNGSTDLAKEYLEVHGNRMSAVLTDFKSLLLRGMGRPRRKAHMRPDKGQAGMIRAFLDAIRSGVGSPIPFEQLYAGALATFGIQTSLRERAPVLIHPDLPGGG